MAGPDVGAGVGVLFLSSSSDSDDDGEGGLQISGSSVAFSKDFVFLSSNSESSDEDGAVHVPVFLSSSSEEDTVLANLEQDLIEQDLNSRLQSSATFPQISSGMIFLNKLRYLLYAAF